MVQSAIQLSLNSRFPPSGFRPVSIVRNDRPGLAPLAQSQRRRNTVEGISIPKREGHPPNARITPKTTLADTLGCTSLERHARPAAAFTGHLAPPTDSLM